MSIRRFILLTPVLVFCLSSGSSADVILLSNGEAIAGQIIGESVDSIEIKAFSGTIKIKKNEIRRIVRDSLKTMARKHTGKKLPNKERPRAQQAGKAEYSRQRQREKVYSDKKLKALKQKSLRNNLLNRIWGPKRDTIEHGSWHLRGTIINVYNESMHSVKVTVRVYDKYNNMLNMTSTYCFPSTLSPHQNGYYDLSLPYDKRIDRFKTDCNWQ